MKHFLCGIVGVAYVLEFYLALYVLERDRVGRVGLGSLLHYLNEASEAADAVLELLHKADERVYGADEEVDRDDECRIITERDATCIQEQTARDENEYVEYVGYEGGRGVELRHRAVGAAGGVNELLVALDELFDLAVGICVSLGYADAGNAALNRGVDGRV